MPSGSIYTYVANANSNDGTNQIVTSQGTVPLGGYGYFLPDEVVIAESRGLILEAGIVGPAQPGTTGPRLVSTLKSTSGTVPVADGNGGYAWESAGSGTITVTDGTNTETGVTEVNFTSGATVSSGGSGIADVSVSGGSSLEVTDGTHTETGVTQISVTGATVGSGGTGVADLTVPTSLPPSGSAGGVLSGSYPNPGLSTSPEAIPNGWTATTQSPSDNSTKVSTTAYTDAAVAVETARAEAAEASISQSLATIPMQEVCEYATAAALASNTYANGSSGVGATLTATANGTLTVDSQNPTTGQRILVQNEATAAHNGIYTVTNAGSGSAAWVLTRATTFNTAAELAVPVLVPVDAEGGTPGSTNDGKIFLSITSATFTVGTTSITFVQVAGTYTAGTGISLSGNQFSLASSGVTAGSYGSATTVPAITVDAEGRVTTAASDSIQIAESQVTNLTTDLAAKAPLASPTFTGTPAAPTPSANDNSTKLATTAYVDGSYTPTTERVNAPGTPGSAQTIPAPQSDTISRLVLTANCTLTFPTAAAGKSFMLQVVQPASGGPYAITWPGSGVVWVAGSAPTQATGANKRDLYSFVCIDGTNWEGIQVSPSGGY